MYNLLKFYKDRITTFVYVDDELYFKEISLDELDFPLSDYFNHVVDFAEEFTVKDFIFLLNKYSTDIDKYFSAFNHGYEFDIFYKETLNNQQKDYIKECDVIEIVWDVDVFKEKGINYISDWVTYIGRINKFKPQHEFDTPTKTMNMIPLRDWKNLPIKLNRSIFYQETSPFRIKKSVIKLEGIRQFNLFNLLSGFIYELTNHGTPEQQISIANEVKNQLKNFGDAMFDSNFSIIPFDSNLFKGSEELEEETLSELNEKMKKYIITEEFEKAQEIKNKINLLKKNQR